MLKRLTSCIKSFKVQIYSIKMRKINFKVRNLPEAMATAAPLNWVSKSLFSEGSPKFSVHEDSMMAIPIARKHEAASKGATGPRANVSTSTFPNSPDKIATRPFPRNIALENVNDSHC